MNKASPGAPARPTPDSNQLPEPRPARRRRGTRCACGATKDLRPFGQYGMICPPCNFRRGTPPVTRCTHCGGAGTDERPLESVGEMGESGCGSLVVAHPDCLPKPRRTTPG